MQQKSLVTQYYAQISGLSEAFKTIEAFSIMTCLSRDRGWNFKGKSRFNSSRSSHRCSNGNTKFQFLFWNATGSFSFKVYRQLILCFTIHMDWGMEGRKGGRFKSGYFLYHKYKRGIKEPNVSSS